MAKLIELLAPAKDYESGVAAINHGADAVYIGAPQFSARAAAGNSIADIEKLCRYAHLYHAHVHVALNTILTDSELETARKLIFQLYEAGTDALIIQDVGILQLGIPPIALHASTQTDNRSPEKVLFWEKVGFQRAILARELSIEQIRTIRQQTTIALEAFVHGALCVSYSGQCYLSSACTGRSANRGECAQLCRLPYTLKAADNTIICENSHLLSLKDMNRAAHIPALLDAGITSLKIEGRLKNIQYVKNITAFYRQQLDTLLEADTRYSAASSGKVVLNFTPAPEKTFHRGSTDYFLYQREDIRVNPDTPKSIGEKIGTVQAVNGNELIINTDIDLHNGDGLGFIAPNGDLQGFRLNTVNENRATTLEPVSDITAGTKLYRNFDIAFEKLIQAHSATRKISVSIKFSDDTDGFNLHIADEDGTSVYQHFSYKKELSNKGEAATEMIRTNLSKLGSTPFYVQEITVAVSAHFFLPAAIVNEWRRQVVERLTEQRYATHLRPKGAVIRPNNYPFPVQTDARLTYLANVLNQQAEKFYKLHGINKIDAAFETNPVSNATLMSCKHCIRYSLQQCRKQPHSQHFPEPWRLLTGNIELLLEFDCQKCEMNVQKL